jgi:hypothetical protein
METKHINPEYDDLFNDSENLNWFPHVGVDYKVENNNNTLFVGESHYYNPDIPLERDIIRKQNFTRLILWDGGIKELNYASQLYKNINRIFSNYTPKELWGKVAFMNFIQKPMNTINQKPNKEDFKLGWFAFFDCVSILKPRSCIFWGNTAAEYFNAYCEENKINHSKVNRIEKINGAYFKTASIVIDSSIINLFFVKHPAARFTVEKWQKKLNEYNLLDSI